MLKDVIKFEPKLSGAPSVLSKKTVLDTEDKYCRVDLLRHLSDDHVLKQYSKELGKSAYMPESTTFLVGLSVIASMACRKWVVTYRDGAKLPIGLYVVAEQPSGSSKTRCARAFQEPFFNAHMSAKRNITGQIADLERNADKLDVQRLDELEQLREWLNSLSGPLFVTNATPEGLELVLLKTGGYFSAVSSEQGLLNSLLGLSYGQQANNNDVVLNAFDGGHISSLRVSRSAYTGRVVGGVACFAQPGSIETILENSHGTGYAERFLLLAEEHSLGRRDHLEQTIVGPELLRAYAKSVDFARHVFEGRTDYDSLTTLRLSAAAHEEIALFRNEIEPHLADGEKYSHISIRGSAAKIDMQVMKIAANLHVTSEHRASNKVHDQYVISAIEMARDLLEANLALCIDKGIIGKKAEYSSILALFESDQRPRSERNIIQGKIRTRPFSEISGNRSKAVRSALDEMVSSGLLVRVVRDNKSFYQLGQ